MVSFELSFFSDEGQLRRTWFWLGALGFWGTTRGWGILCLSVYKVMLGEAVGLAVEWQVTEETTMLPPVEDVVEGSWAKPVPGPSFFEWLGYAVLVVVAAAAFLGANREVERRWSTG